MCAGRLDYYFFKIQIPYLKSAYKPVVGRQLLTLP